MKATDEEVEVKVIAADEKESLKSSGSEFKRIYTADAPKFEKISPAVTVSSAAVEVEVEEGIFDETEKDIVKTNELTSVKSANVKNATLDEYLRRELFVDEAESARPIPSRPRWKTHIRRQQRTTRPMRASSKLITPIVAKEDEKERYFC